MGKVKKKCCRSKPKRCANCPVVAQRLKKIRDEGLSGKELRKSEKAARRY